MSSTPGQKASVFPMEDSEQRLKELQGALLERDQVVEMLTQRLEQAADQLDRMQRSGADRRGPTIGGLPNDFVEGQQSLIEQMNRALAEWEELHATQLLYRIESQIGELKDFVTSHDGLATLNTGGGTSEKVIANATLLKPSATPNPISQQEHSTSAPTSGWDAIRASMMAGGSFSEPPAHSHSTPAPIEPLSTSSAKTTEEREDNRSPLPDPPAFVDVDQVSLEELRAAVLARDEFISRLLRRVTALDQSTQIPDWALLAQVPDKLRRELDELRQRLQDKLRVAEVDLSLQRARVAREEARLHVKAEQVARQMRQMGLVPDEPGTPPNAARSEPETSPAQQGRRWLQFLQRSSGNNPPTSE